MKKFVKKITIGFAVMFALGFATFGVVQAEDPVAGLISEYYSDVDSNLLFFSSIEFISDQGIVKGYDDGTFKPGKLLNRAELLKILVEAKYDKSQFDGYYDQSCFKDVAAKEWYTKYICFAKHADIIQGYEDGTFKPGKTVNLVEALKMALITFSYLYEESDPWYKSFVDGAAQYNFIPLTFRDFDQEVERAEMADLIARILKYEEGNLDEFLGKYKDQKVDYTTLKNHTLVLNGGGSGGGGTKKYDDDLIAEVCGYEDASYTAGDYTYYCSLEKRKIYGCYFVTMSTFGTRSFLQCGMIDVNPNDVLWFDGGLASNGSVLMRQKDDESDEVVVIKTPIELLKWWGEIDSAESAKWFAAAATSYDTIDPDQNLKAVFGNSFELDVPEDEILYTVVKKLGDQYEVPLYDVAIFGCEEFPVRQKIYLVSDNGLALKESKQIGHTTHDGCVD